MADRKVFAEVMVNNDANPDDFARAWITKDLADRLGIVPKKDWIYMSKDWIGVLSTQALVEDIINADGYKVFVSEDRMTDAHFVNGDKPKVWKVTEWE